MVLDRIPPIGLGTWELRGSDCTQVVEEALRIGYRHIDTAHYYENHKAIKNAIAGWNRGELFLTSKLALEQIDLGQVEKSVESAIDLALSELGTDYLDLYIIHWPDQAYPLTQIYRSLEKAREKRKILRAGVSNFTIHHLEDLLKEGCKVEANQVEFHPFLYQKELWDFCKSHHIELISYRSLGKGKLISEPVFKKIGQNHGKSPVQVILRWLVQKKIPVIPKASSKKHLQENFEIFDFKLSNEEMTLMDAQNKNIRFAMPDEPEFNY